MLEKRAMAKLLLGLAFFFFCCPQSLLSQLPISISYNWRPPFFVTETVDNRMNYWGYATSNPPLIRYNLINIERAGLTQEMRLWTRVHEYGHIATMSSNEGTVDCWAAAQLAASDPEILESAITWLDTVFAFQGGPAGTGRQRAAWMRQCRQNAAQTRPQNRPGPSGPSRRYGIPPPSKPGNRVNDVNSNPAAERFLKYEDEEAKFDTNPDKPYLKYKYEFRNVGTRELECKAWTAVDVKRRSTREIVIEKWNIDEKKFTIKPNQTKKIDGRVQWYGDSVFFPSSDYFFDCDFKK